MLNYYITEDEAALRDCPAKIPSAKEDTKETVPVASGEPEQKQEPVVVHDPKLNLKNTSSITWESIEDDFDHDGDDPEEEEADFNKYRLLTFRECSTGQSKRRPPPTVINKSSIFTEMVFVALDTYRSMAFWNYCRWYIPSLPLIPIPIDNTVYPLGVLLCVPVLIAVVI